MRECAETQQDTETDLGAEVDDLSPPDSDQQASPEDLIEGG